MTDLIPPSNIEAEESVLSAVLIENAGLNEVVDFLYPDDFYKTVNKKIYTSMLQLVRDGKPIDLVTLMTHLRDIHELEAVGGAPALSRLIDAVPLASDIVYYGRIVKDAAIRRRIILASHRSMQLAHDTTKPIDEVVDIYHQGALAIDTESDEDVMVYGEKVIEKMDQLEEAWDKKILVTGIPTGFDALDRVTCGFQKSDLIILAARPSMGKTAMALQIADHAESKGYKPLIFSLEQPWDQLMDRSFADYTMLPTQDFRTGRWKRSDWTKIADAAARLANSKLRISDNGDLTYRDIRKMARREVKKNGVDFIIVDHLQKLTGAGNKSRNDEVSIYSRQMKAMAKELRLPVLLLSQLSRAVEKRGDKGKRPQLADLRDSGAIEQDADVVIFIYRDEVYHTDEDNPNKGKAEIIVAKQRQGPTCMLPLVWMAAYTKFENLYEGQECYT